MLTDKDIAILNNCLLDDHLLIEIEKYFVSTESATIRERLNSGESLTNEELWKLPYSESLTSEFEYLTLFIDGENVSSQFKEWLIVYNLIDAFQSSDTTGVTISFPEKV